MSYPRLVAIVLVSLLAAACGGGGGGGPPDDGSTGPAPNVTGWWLESWDDRLDPKGIQPFQLVELLDDGATVEYFSHILLKDDRALSGNDPNASAPDRQIWRYTIESSNRIAGYMEQYRGGVLDVAQLRRMTPAAMPTGTLVVNGRIDGSLIDVDAVHAYVVETRHGGGQVNVRVVDPDQAEYTALNLVGWGPPPIPAATYEVGYDPGELQLYVRLEAQNAQASTGNIVLTTSTSDRVAGWFVVTLDDDASLSGSFDARIRINVE